MTSVGLQDLIFPSDKEEFLRTSWPEDPFVVHGLGSSVRGVMELPFLQSLEALLQSWPMPVQAHLPDVSDESSAVDVSPENARKLFSNGLPLLFNQVQKISPMLTKSLLRLREDLGLPQSTFARCLVYATPDGRGTAPHFDQNVNFVLQIHGTKKWWLAPNFHVENPTERFTMGQALDSELASYAAAEMPSEMPGDRQEIVLRPGSMLFVPRGYWHATEAQGEALALNFTFSQPTWVDLFTSALRSRLLLSPEWRQLADGVGSQNLERRQQSEMLLDQLLLELVEDLPNWKASDILSATEGEDFE